MNHQDNFYFKIEANKFFERNFLKVKKNIINVNNFKYNSILNITSTDINSDSNIYKIKLHLQKNNIALLENILITNLINPIIFNKYNFYYNSLINLANSFYININKTYIYSNNLISLYIYIDKYYLYNIYIDDFNYIQLDDSIINNITDKSNLTTNDVKYIKIISTITSESNLYSNFYEYILFNYNYTTT